MGSGGRWGSGDGRCMTGFGAGIGACMMDDSDGTGEGECGNEIWVMGMPLEGWLEGLAAAEEAGADAGADGATGGAEDISEMIGVDAGSGGRPPYPGRPYCKNGCADAAGQPSTSASREMSLICCCMP